MKNIKIFPSKYFIYSTLLISGIFLGWLVFHPSTGKETMNDQTAVAEQETIWTCAMHPQIRMAEPGKCPICGMDLIPLVQNGTAGMDPDAIRMTAEAAQLANVQTSVVSRQIPVKEIRLYGKVQIDEQQLQSQVAHFSGRLEHLDVNFTGESVVVGQTLGQIYSPELITSQQELLQAAETKLSQPEIYEAAKEKLRQWKLSDRQIEAIEESGTIQSSINIISTTSGVVISRRVNTGDYVSQGTVLFDIADLSKVWVMFDAYESDLPFLKIGEKISFTIQAIPGHEYNGRVTFIDPVIDAVARVAKVRVEAGNSAGSLKPGMFATGIISSVIGSNRANLYIPRSSVLWTGKRSVVYVKEAGTDDPVFKMREITLGPAVGEGYIVKEGLAEGDEIVTQGTFSVDAAAQLEGKPSMMNPAKGTVTEAHDHGDMPGMPEMQASQKETFMVSGNCEMCKDRIESAAKSVKGITSASWDMNSKMINIEFTGSVNTVDAVQKAIAEAGHDNVGYKASDEVYNALPECCLYRK
jgi:Cu(I)/Ag(I) efflux system membrane fusion protein